MENTKKMLIYKIIFCILTIIAIVFIVILGIKQYNDFKYNRENKEIVDLFHEQENNQDEISLKYKGYKVIGIIKIPVIDLEYPILEQTTKETMNISISRFYGGDINEPGNVSLAGHNNYNGTMFGKNKNLNVDDIFYLTDLKGRTLEYKIYDKFTTDPNDVSILEIKDETIREVTLITCKNGRSQRLILKAKEILSKGE